MPDWKTRLNDAWVAFSLRRTWTILAVAAAVFVGSAYFASKLGLRSDFLELLPTDSPSVLNLELMKNRISSYATLTVAVESPDLAANQKFTKDLVARLQKFPVEKIRFIDWSLTELTRFYDKNKYLFADLKDLADFRERLKQRIAEETAANVVESLDDEPRHKTDLKTDEMKAKYEEKAGEKDRYPGGYYVGENGKLIAFFVRPPANASGFEDSQRLIDDIQVEIDALNPASYNADMKVGFTGDVKTGLEERDALAADMEFISIIALIGILLVIVLYYRSLRSLVLIGLPMLLGLVMAFAVAYFAIGYLNAATAFLSSIVAGNGINFMIMLAARFYEEIRTTGPEGLEPALRVSVRDTAKGTLVAAGAASIAYGSLLLAGFRGFRQFGIIGGAGMILCWIATFAVGPALIAALHRIRPLALRRVSQHHPLASPVGRLVVGHPRIILLVALVVSGAAFLVSIGFAFDPFEYDFHNLRNRVGAERGSAQLSRRVDRIFDLPSSPTPCVVDDLASVQRIQKNILAAPDVRSMIGDVKTLFDLLPADQQKKLAVLADIRDMVDKKVDFLSPEDKKKVDEYRPPDDLRVLTIDDIPDLVARPYTEADGTRGRVFYIYSNGQSSLLDGKYLLKFAKFVRGVDLKGDTMIATGQPMVFADMVAAILHDGVRVTIAAAVGVLLLLILAFRSRIGTTTIVVSVGLGTLWMIGFAALFDLKLNFLNFVVIPITLGIGADYGANIFARYRIEGPGSVANVLKSTGGAVVLSSATTIIGYASLITSTNMALQSFGIIADIGEFTCLATAEIVMTALIVWRENSRKPPLKFRPAAADHHDVLLQSGGSPVRKEER